MQSSWPSPHATFIMTCTVESCSDHRDGQPPAHELADRCTTFSDALPPLFQRWIVADLRCLLLPPEVLRHVATPSLVHKPPRPHLLHYVGLQELCEQGSDPGSRVIEEVMAIAFVEPFERAAAAKEAEHLVQGLREGGGDFFVRLVVDAAKPSVSLDALGDAFAQHARHRHTRVGEEDPRDGRVHQAHRGKECGAAALTKTAKEEGQLAVRAHWLRRLLLHHDPPRQAQGRTFDLLQSLDLLEGQWWEAELATGLGRVSFQVHVKVIQHGKAQTQLHSFPIRQVEPLEARPWLEDEDPQAVVPGSKATEPRPVLFRHLTGTREPKEGVTRLVFAGAYLQRDRCSQSIIGIGHDSQFVHDRVGFEEIALECDALLCHRFTVLLPIQKVQIPAHSRGLVHVRWVHRHRRQRDTLPRWRSFHHLALYWLHRQTFGAARVKLREVQRRCNSPARPPHLHQRLAGVLYGILANLQHQSALLHQCGSLGEHLTEPVRVSLYVFVEPLIKTELDDATFPLLAPAGREHPLLGAASCAVADDVPGLAEGTRQPRRGFTANAVKGELRQICGTLYV
mmetsp:Transcript_25666/g.59726  ORF Transcript_25666/g.59726 Transcript_25666/m.59726 type:complete len:567 (-) Transcript_25666:715-2415(-)